MNSTLSNDSTDSSALILLSTESIKKNIKEEEAQLIVSAMTELHRNCLIDKFKTPIKIEATAAPSSLNSTDEAFKQNGKNKLASLVEFCKHSERTSDSNEGKINVYVDEEVILEISEYTKINNNCNVCLKKFQNSILNHFNEHIKHDKMFCILCTQEFFYPIQSSMHVCEYVNFDEPLIHNLTDIIYYSCKLCSSNNNTEYFTDYELYSKHVKNVHQPTLICMLCANKFNTPDSYIHHLKFHHSITNLFCSCQDCVEKKVELKN